MNNELGERLKLFRTKEDLSLSEMGEAVGKNKSQLSKYENGDLMVPIEVVQALHSKYGLSYQRFFDGTGRMKLSSDEKRKDILTDLNELQAKYASLEAKFKNLEVILKKLHADFYAKK